MTTRGKILIFFVIFTLVIFSKTSFAYASVEISEIMYDLAGTDTDHEWIELHSIGTTNIADYKFNDGSSHTINPPGTNGSTGSMSIPDNGYIVLAANATVFLADHAGFSGTVLDTVMSLTNTGTTIKIVDSSGATVATATYSSSMGAAGDGNSLNKDDTTYKPGTESPGKENSLGSNSNNETNTTTEQTQTKAEVVDKSKFEIVLSKENIYTKSPFIIYPDVKNYSGEKVSHGYFSWNFGDGNSKVSNDNTQVPYQYDYPGTYILTLDYSEYTYPQPDQIISKSLEIDVVDPSLKITKVGDTKDPYVEISNLSENNIDISGYILQSKTSSIYFPKNTKIYAKSKITVPSKVSHFAFADIAQVSLLFENGEVVDTFPAVLVQVIASSPIKSARQSSSFGSSISSQSTLPSNNITLTQADVSQTAPENISKNNSANAIIAYNDAKQSTSKKTRNIFLITMIVVSGATVIYLLRNRTDSEKDEKDFIYDE